MTTPPANWYADPYTRGRLRYWDGARWTDHTAPAPAPLPPYRNTPSAGPLPSATRPDTDVMWETPAPSSWFPPSDSTAYDDPGLLGLANAPVADRNGEQITPAGMGRRWKVLAGSIAGVLALAAIGSAFGEDTRNPSVGASPKTAPSAGITTDAPAGLAGAPTGQDGAGTSQAEETAAPSSSTTGPTLYPVTSVLDGDTIKVRIKGTTYRVRVLGIDTPELATKDCFAQQAASKMQSLVQSKSVALRRDSRQPDKDQYGRLVRHVILADGSYAGYALIKGGFAKEYVPRGDYAGRPTFLQAQAYAKAKKLGVWSAVCAAPKPTSPAPLVSPPKPPTSPKPPVAV